MNISKTVIIKSSFIIFIFIYIINSLINNNGHMFIDYLNLCFHELGHMIFMLFGEFIHFTGGTIMQIAIPAGITVYLIIIHKYYGASIFGIWTGQNLFGISEYIKDARSQVLPLFGGGIHDWNYMLGELNLLKYDQIIGNVVYSSGLVIIIISSIFGIIFAVRNCE